MAVEKLVVVAAAEGGAADFPDPQFPPLPYQLLPHIQVALPAGRCRKPEGLKYFRTYFITRAANTYATMHYQVSCDAPCTPLQEAHSPLQNPATRPPPPCVEQGHRPGDRIDEVDRGAICHGDGQQDASGIRGVAVYPVEEEPAAPTLVPDDLRSVDLAAEGDKGEAWLDTAEGRPLPQHPPNRLVAGKAKVEWFCGGTARGEAGDDPETLAPTRDCHSGDRPIAEELFLYDCHIVHGGLPTVWQGLKRRRVARAEHADEIGRRTSCSRLARIPFSECQRCSAQL